MTPQASLVGVGPEGPQDIETAQDLLRHAMSRLTLELYTHAVSRQKRDANNKVVELLPGLVKAQHLLAPSPL